MYNYNVTYLMLTLVKCKNTYICIASTLKAPLKYKDLTLKKKSVKLYTDSVLDQFYKAIRTNTLHKLHIPHSSVFYVRAAIQAKTGKRYTLRHVEQSMRAEGWSDSV